MTEDQKQRLATQEAFRQAYESAGWNVEEFLGELAYWLLSNRLLSLHGLDLIVFQVLRERAAQGDE